MSNYPSEKKPYYAENQNCGFWLVVDSRNGKSVSYPSTEAQAKAGARTMNRAYAEAIAE